LGPVKAIRHALPDIPIHASTQMSLHNLAGVEAAADMGITRAVLARELSFEQIKFITKNASIETEVFVHGALCMSFSGQCYLSAMLGHASLDTTMMYAHVVDSDLQRQYEKYHTI
jgi:putative protease